MHATSPSGGPLNAHGAGALVELEPAETGGASVHLVVNAYDASQQTPFARWFEDGLARYVHTKALPDVLKRSGRQLPSSAWQNRPAANSMLTEPQFDGWRRVNSSAFSGPSGWTTAETQTAPSTVESVNAEIAGIFDGDTTGAITVLATADELPSRVREKFKKVGAEAVTLDRDRVYLAADRLERGTVRSVLMHGMGVSPGANLPANDSTSATPRAADSSDGTRGAEDGGSLSRLSRSPRTDQIKFASEDASIVSDISRVTQRIAIREDADDDDGRALPPISRQPMTAQGVLSPLAGHGDDEALRLVALCLKGLEALPQLVHFTMSARSAALTSKIASRRSSYWTGGHEQVVGGGESLT